MRHDHGIELWHTDVCLFIYIYMCVSYLYLYINIFIVGCNLTNVDFDLLDAGTHIEKAHDKSIQDFHSQNLVMVQDV